MKQDKLAGWLKFIILGVGLCILIVYVFVVPMFGRTIVDDAPEFAGWYVPWLVFISITAVPVFIALFFCWKVANNIGNDRSFSMDNANLLKWISWLAAADSAYFFIGNIVLLLLNMSHPGMTLSRRHSRRGLVGRSTFRRTPISRSPLDKNPMPGHLFELHPVNEVNTKGQ